MEKSGNKILNAINVGMQKALVIDDKDTDINYSHTDIKSNGEYMICDGNIKESDDPAANAIIDYIYRNYNIEWDGDNVNSLIDKEPTYGQWRCMFGSGFPIPEFDSIYRIAQNSGIIIHPGIEYASHNWFIFVKGNNCMAYLLRLTNDSLYMPAQNIKYLEDFDIDIDFYEKLINLKKKKVNENAIGMENILKIDDTDSRINYRHTDIKNNVEYMICDGNIKESTDPVANAIVDYVYQNFNIQWDKKYVDSLIEKENNDGWWRHLFGRDFIMPEYDSVYRMAQKEMTKDPDNSKYAATWGALTFVRDAVPYNWFIFVKDNHCTIYMLSLADGGHFMQVRNIKFVDKFDIDINFYKRITDSKIKRINENGNGMKNILKIDDIDSSINYRKSQISSDVDLPEICDGKIQKSEDNIANRIINYMWENYKIVWKGRTVDDLIHDATNESYWRTVLKGSGKLPKHKRVYYMSCWDGGFSLNKNSRFNVAEITRYTNNTDIKWILFVNRNVCTVYKHERRYYGQEDRNEIIEVFVF